MEKQIIIAEIIAALRQECASVIQSARAARADATGEQSKAENKYDTRGLEASYLARGQSLQAAEAMRNICLYESLAPRELSPGEPIEAGTLVELEQDHGRSFCFIGPGGGGTKVDCNGATVLVLTAQSPLGKQLIGRKAGDQFEIRFGREVEKYRVVSAR